MATNALRLFRSKYKITHSRPFSISSHHYHFKHCLRSFGSNNHHNIDVSDLFTSSDDDDSDQESIDDIPNDNKDDNKDYNKIDNTQNNQQSTNRLIISNLNENTNRTDLYQLCSKYGTITDIYLPMDINNNSKHRGFGYVSFQTTTQTQQAFKAIYGTKLNCNTLKVGYAKPNQVANKTAVT